MTRTQRALTALRARPLQRHHGRRQHRPGGLRPRIQHHGQRQHRHGAFTLEFNIRGSENTATGFQALLNNTTGDANTATGAAPSTATPQASPTPPRDPTPSAATPPGIFNTAIGFNAGTNVTRGSHNIHIGSAGIASDTDLIRIGTVGVHTSTFIAGIRDVVITGDPVVVSAAGQLLLQRALGAIESFGMAVFHALFVTQLGEAQLFAGELSEAHALAERALTLAREHGERDCAAGAFRLLGDIAVRGDPPDLEKAEGYHHRAIALAEELGMRPLVAHCHFGLSKLYQRTGKREQAHEHLSTATAMYRDMDMTYWLEKAEVEIDQLLS
jgi:hypothetical protein